jgi:hypothetical protein
LVQIARVLKRKGLAIVTVRLNMFEENEQGWKQEISNAGMVLKKQEEMPYYGEIRAYVLVLERQ